MFICTFNRYECLDDGMIIPTLMKKPLLFLRYNSPCESSDGHNSFLIYSQHSSYRSSPSPRSCRRALE
ncbi:hypothetical protein FJD32_019765 [Shewanella sp. LC6]|nr:hypothetical protein FJD32_019765 [Shewanella sp. LC6]TPE56829.1 hypothetical protein FJD33_13465 [Shewanella sp. LC2]